MRPDGAEIDLRPGEPVGDEEEPGGIGGPVRRPAPDRHFFLDFLPFLDFLLFFDMATFLSLSHMSATDMTLAG